MDNNKELFEAWFDEKGYGRYSNDKELWKEGLWLCWQAAEKAILGRAE